VCTSSPPLPALFPPEGAHTYPIPLDCPQGGVILLYREDPNIGRQTITFRADILSTDGDVLSEKPQFVAGTNSTTECHKNVCFIEGNGYFLNPRQSPRTLRISVEFCRSNTESVGDGVMQITVTEFCKAGAGGSIYNSDEIARFRVELFDGDMNRLPLPKLRASRGSSVECADDVCTVQGEVMYISDVSWERRILRYRKLP
jgi:hypothetical protein